MPRKLTSPPAEKRRGPGRPEVLQDEHVEVLRDIVRARPSATLAEISTEFARRAGFTICWPTIRKGLKRAGVRRVHGELASDEQVEAQPRSDGRQYGYTETHRDAGDAERYGTCLTDAEWELVADIFEREGGRGKPPTYARRLLVDACCYVVRTGCSWRLLPKDFPVWTIVYKTFRRWTDGKRFEAMHDRLRGMWRERAERQVGPTAGVLDSQSVKTSPQGGPKGYDAAKKVKGRKRHILVDTLGLILALAILPANIQDRDGAPPVVAKAMEKYPSIKKLYVDGAYGGECKAKLELTHKLDVEVVRHPANGAVGRWQDAGQQSLFPVSKGFVVLPKRWVVERTHSWNDRSRRLAKDHDRRTDVGESWIWLTEARLLVRRLTA
jgi:transposase